MINKAAVTRFLARRLHDFDWIKNADSDYIEEQIKALRPIPRFHTPPFRHQQEMFIIGAHNDQFLFFADMGSGKTLVLLELIKWRKQAKKPHKALICVPNIINLDTWLEQTEKHTPSLKCLPLYGSSAERAELINQDADLYVLNYQGLTALLTDSTKNKKGQTVWTYNKDRVDDFAQHFDVAVFDESHKLGNWTSQYYKICNRITDTVKVCYALTGTPFGRDPQKLWSQFHMIDKGNTLGYTLSIFRAAYFDEQKKYWRGKDKPPILEYKLLQGADELLHKNIRNKSLVYTADECQDLPDKSYNSIYVNFSREGMRYYNRAISAIRKAGGIIDYDNFIRLRQMTAGFVGAKIDGEKIEVEFAENPKLDALLELIDDINPRRKIIVFHEFIPTGKIISAALKKEKIKHATLWGETRDKNAQKRKFIDDPSCRVFVVNSAAGGTGLDGLQAVSNYVIFVDLPVDPITRSQAEKRCHRTGQQRKVIFYDIIMRRSVDHRIIDFIKQGKSLIRSIMQGKEKV